MKQVDSPLIGLLVKLERNCDRPCSCKGDEVEIVAGAESTLDLACACCGKRRGRMGKNTTAFLEHLCALCGRPTKPITVRASRVDYNDCN